jgi:hypothetical protein
VHVVAGGFSRRLRLPIAASGGRRNIDSILNVCVLSKKRNDRGEEVSVKLHGTIGAAAVPERQGDAE